MRAAAGKDEEGLTAVVAEATGIIFQPFEEVPNCSFCTAAAVCRQWAATTPCTMADTWHNAMICVCWHVQVKGELQRIEQLLDSNNGTSQSLARFNYATDLEAAINEQIK
jgi:hypothetical protein